MTSMCGGIVFNNLNYILRVCLFCLCFVLFIFLFFYLGGGCLLEKRN